MGYAAADSPVDRLAGNDSVDEAGGEAVAATDTVEDVDFDLRNIDDLVLVEGNGAPGIAAGGACGAQGAGDEFQIWIRSGDFAEHLFVSSDGEFGKIIGDSLEFDAEHGGEIFFVAEEEVDFANESAVDFLRFCFAADRAPERVAVVEIVGDEGAVSAGGVHGFGRHVSGGSGQRGEDAAGVQALRAVLISEDVGPGKVTGFDLADGGVAAVAATGSGAQSESTLGEVEAIANCAANAVERDPAQKGGVDAALEDEVFDEAADGIVGKRGGDGCSEAKAASKAASDVIFATAFPDGKPAGGVDAAFAWVETEHDLAEADAVPAAIRFVNQKGFHGRVIDPMKR